MKKNVLTASALGVVVALGLTACSSASDPDASASASAEAEWEMSSEDIATLEGVEWTENKKGVPTLEFEQPMTVSDIATLSVSDGDGDVIEDGQSVSLDYVVYSGEDGSEIYSTYDADTPEVVSMVEGQVVDQLYDALVGKNVGADLIYAYPDTSTEDGTAVLMAVTASDAFTPLERAEGEAVEPAEDLPAVTLDETGAPSVDFSEAGDMPEELVAQTLIKGEGDKVAVGDSITVHYTGWVWDGDQFDSSWANGSSISFTLSSDSLIEGWVQGLEGQTVGSQVLLVIPPDLGYGEQESDSIPANSTLVFVVDILATN